MGPSSSAPAPRAETLIGGRYRTERLLGKGGMGAVYAALDTSSGKRVALKRLGRFESPKMLELFKREWQTLRGLRHARIIEVYDFGSDEEGAFYTMELLEGSDLSESAPMHWRQVCLYLREVASILGVLHARRLLHRDLSAKNLWRLPNGHIKLIDFGALASFGVPTETVGTPPLIAPEALHSQARAQAIDQRADLYALGALGYWLLTSVHAYPARSLGELETAWQRTPVPPSSLVKLVQDAAAEPMPEALDALVMSLLQLDPAARPESTDVLIDRINTLAGFEAESEDSAVQGYFHSKVFVGRAEERERAVELLRQAQRGATRGLLVESPEGMGRTRFLEELSVLGRLSGVTTVAADGGKLGRAYSTANSLALRLIDALPQQALALAEPHAGLLGHLSPELRARLGGAPLSSLEDNKQARLRLQGALTTWLYAVTREHCVMLLVDDLESVDEESAAWLAALIHEKQAGRLLIVAALRREPGSDVPLAAQAFRAAAVRIRLQALTASQTEELLRSVFGAVPYLQTTAERLHQVSMGQPAYCFALVKHLVDTGIAGYADGAWSLPSHLLDAQLPRSRGEAHLARLAQLTPEARVLAQLLSVHDGAISRTVCDTLSDLTPEDTTRALLELTLTGVLTEAQQSYHFQHEDLRDALAAELVGERRALAERRAGESLIAQAAGDPIERMRGALALFRAGDRDRAEQLVREAVTYLVQGHSARFGEAIPLLEQTVALYRAADLDAYSLVHPLAMLGSASYYVDHRLARRYGDAALDACEKLLHFDLARKLQPVVGAKLALYAALSAGAIDAAHHRPHAPQLADTLRMLIGCASALNAVATSSVDPAATARCRRALQPLEVLGDDNVAGFLQRCVVSVGALLIDRPAETMRLLRARADRLESPKPIDKLTEGLRIDCLAGCYMSIGVVSCWRNDPQALEIAARIEGYGPIYAMSADNLRATYYASQGDLARSAEFRQRVETHALQLGASWQVATWAPVGLQITALWTCDAMLAKRAARELAHLARELPSLQIEAQRARCTYLVLRGRYQDVIDLVLADRAPPSQVGWTRTQGLLARAYNGLGQHAHAREVCQRALAPLSDVDRSYVMMTLHVQIELALAEAGLGHFENARRQLDALVELHTSGGPLACGALHEASAMAAILERDFERARAHIERMSNLYRPTGIATLLELSDALVKRLEFAERGPDAHDHLPTALTRDDDRLVTRVRLILTHTEASLPLRAQKGLEIALQLSGADTGFLVLPESNGQAAAYSGSIEPAASLVSWAEERMRLSEGDETVIDTLDTASPRDMFKVIEETQYCVVTLWTDDRDAAEPTAAIVLGFLNKRPRYPDREVLHVIAGHLFDARSE